MIKQIKQTKKIGTPISKFSGPVVCMHCENNSLIQFNAATQGFFLECKFCRRRKHVPKTWLVLVLTLPQV